jgi:hypothetical protein
MTIWRKSEAVAASTTAAGFAVQLSTVRYLGKFLRQAECGSAPVLHFYEKIPPLISAETPGSLTKDGEWSRCKGIADSHTENFLPIVQIFGVQHRCAGPRRRDHNQCIPEGKLRLVSQSNSRSNRRIIDDHQGPSRQIVQNRQCFLDRATLAHFSGECYEQFLQDLGV